MSIPLDVGNEDLVGFDVNGSKYLGCEQLFCHLLLFLSGIFPLKLELYSAVLLVNQWGKTFLPEMSSYFECINSQSANNNNI